MHLFMSGFELKSAVLASLARKMKNSDDPVFGTASNSHGKEAQAAYFRYRDMLPETVQPVLLRPYLKSTGKSIISARESRRAMILCREDPAEFASRYRLIARMTGVDKMIAKVLAYYLSQLLEGLRPGSASSREAYLSQDCYAYRRNRGVHHALDCFEQWTIREGLSWVARTDIKSYFDMIRRDRLHQQLKDFFNVIGMEDEHSTRWIMALASAPKKLGWKVVVGPAGKEGGNKSNFEPDIPVDHSLGIPQGNPLSAPLSNLYLNEVDHSMAKEGCAKGFNYLRYADDIVICAGSRREAEKACDLLRDKIQDLGLALSDKKTEIDQLNSGSITFLGYRYLADGKGKEVSPEKLRKFRRKIEHLTSRQHVGVYKGSHDRDALIGRVIHDVNIRILVTRAVQIGDETVMSLSPRSFPVHYAHNQEPAVYRQMQMLDAFIRWRVARCLVAPNISDRDCHKVFFGKLLPERNARASTQGRQRVSLIPLTGVFKNIPKFRNAGAYGVAE